MYLYVFQVDKGLTFSLDLNLSTESVRVLKQNIYAVTGIASEKQALLLSGGETLYEDAKVSSYRSAGTETNPIFLFNKEAADLEKPPSPIVENTIDTDMKERIKSCFNMEPSFSTVLTRSELAQQLHAMAQSHLEFCEKLIQDQHLQHQGWAAVMANIEDHSKDIVHKLERLDEEYQKFKEREPIYNQSIDRLQTDLEILNRMPLLPPLVESSLVNREHKEVSLADWIGFRWSSLKDVNTMVKSVLEFQHKSHEDFMANIKQEKKTVLSIINSKEIKEISGLQNRLQTLDSLLIRASKLTNELSEFAQAFRHNHTRASNIRDNSILPDLCRTHESQLKVVAEKYTELCDIRDRCVTAKREFCGVIHRRLQWATHISRLISGLSHKQTLWVNSFRRMEKFINVFDQIHRTPIVYLNFIGETYRRRVNSKRFLTWANDVATTSRSFYDKEIELRREFEEKISQHFLKALFSGMEDEPPLFAAVAPEPFDDQVPEITECDIARLMELFPQYRSLLEMPQDVPFETHRLDSPPKRRIVSIDFEEKQACQEQLPEETYEPEQEHEQSEDDPEKFDMFETPERPSTPEATDTPEQVETMEHTEEPNVPEPILNLERPRFAKIHFPVDIPNPEQDKISYFSSAVGDLVLLTFNTVHNCYVAFVNSTYPHFLHHECLGPLGFLIGDGKEVPAYGFGIITEKVLCQASKPQNRYNVPINTRFYRFKAKQWAKANVGRPPPIPLIHVTLHKQAVQAISVSTMDPNLQKSILPVEYHLSSQSAMNCLHSPSTIVLEDFKSTKEETGNKEETPEESNEEPTAPTNDCVENS